MNRTARVFEIERFAIHDGPGIRTTVFLKGCPLHCPWCSNPESQSKEKILMHNAIICIGCGNCVAACPNGLITFDGMKPVFSQHQCGDCLLCAEACIKHAIKIAGEDMSIDEIMNVILRDEDYYTVSGGGVTFSGGEVMTSISALEALLDVCHKANIHTAIETTGNAPLASFKRIVDKVDLFLFDVKQTDGELLKEVTGGDWKMIYQNLEYLAQDHSDKLILRVPCIPDFNVNDSFFDRLFQLAIDKNIKMIDLLSYHSFGKDKYRQMGEEYSYVEESLDKNLLKPYADKGKRLGLDVKIQ